VLADGTPYGFTNFEWVGGSAMGAYSFKDGMPTAWSSHTQLCNIGNSEEFEYLIPPTHHLGRKLEPGYCGHGKYRGGIGQSAVHWMKETGQRLGVSRGGVATSLTSYVSLGMNGGYPAPGVVTVTATKTNLDEVFEAGGDTPTTAGELLEYAKEGKITGNVTGWKYDPPEQTLEDNDLWANAAGGSGGWGDPLERDVDAVVNDINVGQVPEGFAKVMYGVVVSKGDNNQVVLNESETAKEREKLYAQRRSESIPAKQWWAEERNRIIQKTMRDEVIEMYRKSLCFNGYDKHFRGFWQLGNDFKI
jgi:N-methylhydantoinase B/acetone carboxylase alpha subunit